jgi:hypothetical protein
MPLLPLVLTLLVTKPIPSDEVVIGGWVEDMRDGSPVMGAEVIMYWAASNGEVWEQAVDNDGSFAFRGLRPVAYLIEVRIGDQFQFFRGTFRPGARVLLNLTVDRAKLKRRSTSAFQGTAVDSMKTVVRRIPRY